LCLPIFSGLPAETQGKITGIVTEMIS